MLQLFAFAKTRRLFYFASLRSVKSYRKFSTSFARQTLGPPTKPVRKLGVTYEPFTHLLFYLIQAVVEKGWYEWWESQGKINQPSNHKV
ncbi:hypothetical protein BC938DRAFT_480369 [Jimgerdemannia flammicorona]|uniref:Uncharacterized protein n=1 Tax=Jimgerdemannia flammicorona TaxID=994334 RepID=A0A433QIW8_9FUNG|nr:hypothetical protein BC938DRAFT_480369 [Jimgerdemannia flammicorona]